MEEMEGLILFTIGYRVLLLLTNVKIKHAINTHQTTSNNDNF